MSVVFFTYNILLPRNKGTMLLNYRKKERKKERKSVNNSINLMSFISILPSPTTCIF